MLALNIPSENYEKYLDHLTKNPAETRKLYDALTINVTQFFRDLTLWNYLKDDLLPKIAGEKLRNGAPPFLVWSCGCSSGEEPYSLAILLLEIFKPIAAPFKIMATDIDVLSLEKAKRGIYDMAAFPTTPKEFLVKYFHQVKDERGQLKYEIDPSVKKYVEFRIENFFRDAPPVSNADLIICRNVIIYFTPEAKDKLLSIFSRSLADHGFLILGKSEVLFTTKSQHKFYLYNTIERVYRKERREEREEISDDRRRNWWHGYQDEIAREK